MRLGWKVLIPGALVWILLIATIRVWRRQGGSPGVYIVAGLLIIAGLLAAAWAWDVAEARRARQAEEIEAAEAEAEAAAGAFPVPALDLPQWDRRLRGRHSGPLPPGRPTAQGTRSPVLKSIKGFGVTFRTMFHKVDTVQYPEGEKADRPPVPRPAPAQPLAGRPGEMHRLRAVRLGLPGRCHLRGGRRQHRGGAVLPRGAVRARLPDQLPALYPAGRLCIEACPTRALTMTNEYEIADDNRESLIWTKEQLVAPLQPGMEAPPHPMRLGETERDYYLLGASGEVGNPRVAEEGRLGTDDQ